ncbi:MAG TPA: hypothetical protein VHZ73_07825 [Vicinamibacterales bacterium]|nr:hypothetical protein [Vicinamibacterales bacterium]
MIAAFLLAAIAIDLALIELAARPSGFSRALGPVHLRLHDPSALLIILAILTGALVARGWHTRARGWALAVAPVTTAIAATAVTGHAERMFPLGDIAVIELYVRTALEGRLLVGPYSRFGWHHPGPAYFYLLAPFYAVSDHATASLAAGAAVIAMACIALLAWLAARTSGPRTAALLLLVTIALLARTPGLVVSAWNPHVVVLPAMVLIVAAAGAAGGDVALLPLAALVASFVAQTDVALVPLVFVVGIIAVLGALTATWGTNRYALLKAANTAAWVVLACWLVPAAEELTHSPGNLTRLWHFFVDARGTGQPLQAAAAAWATMVAGVLRPTFDLAGGGLFEANGGSTAPLVAVVELCALAAVAWWAWSRDRSTARLALVSLAA